MTRRCRPSSSSSSTEQDPNVSSLRHETASAGISLREHLSALLETARIFFQARTNRTFQTCHGRSVLERGTLHGLFAFDRLLLLPERRTALTPILFGVTSPCVTDLPVRHNLSHANCSYISQASPFQLLWVSHMAQLITPLLSSSFCIVDLNPTPIRVPLANLSARD